MPLEEYKRKRRFGKTPEPAGKPHRDGGRLYVIQKHAARRLHYDFRLELDGVLLSWAIPKGPSLDPADKHLAVRVEDHPVEYGAFEGVIPKGEYGAGTVMLWDRGTWEPAGDPHEGLRKGDLKFRLDGEKLRGEWVLVHMKRRSAEEDKENWLLIKHRDDEARPGDGGALLRERGESVASGRTMEEIAAEKQSVWHSDEPAEAQTEVRRAEDARLELSELPGAKRQPKLPRFVPPELATLVKAAPPGEKWIHEIKYDGYRAEARIEDGKVVMTSRRDKDWTAKFRRVAEELAKLPVRSAIIDGEVCVQLPDGRTSFQALQGELGERGGEKLVYFAFDILHLDGYDLTGVPLTERKRVLRLLLGRLGTDGGRIRYSEDIAGNGPAFLGQACGHGLEGIVSKRAQSSYLPGVRGKDWLKTKCVQSQEFAIVGWTDPAGSRTGFGALLLAVQEEGGLRYAGKVGTGFSDRFLADFGERLRSIGVDRPPLREGVEAAPKGAHWVKPRYVGEVDFIEWTADGHTRHATFKGLREDKAPSEVVAEEPVETPSAGEAEAAAGGAKRGGKPAGGGGRREAAREKAAGGAKRGARAGRGTPALLEPPATTPVAGGKKATGGAVDFGGVRLTNPAKQLYPDDGITKLDIARYYASIADWMLPHVLHRPVSMVRCPEGVEPKRGAVREDEGRKDCFFHKHAGEDFVGPFERLSIPESGGPAAYLAVSQRESLYGLAQMGVLEIHMWGCRSDDIEHPDYMVFDLDPDSPEDWPKVVQGARFVRGVLDGLGLVSFLKTTGGKGLHVVVPLKPREDWDGVKDFAEAVARGIASYAPDDYVATMSKAKRKGKVFVDYLRNARSNTSIAPYSTRARAHATVSAPIRWEELSTRTKPNGLTIENLPRRLARLKSDPWEGYFDVEQTITPKMKREIGLT